MPQYMVILSALGGLILTWVTVVKLLLPLGRTTRGGWRRFWGMVDTVIGRDEPVKDRATGKEIAPSIPPLANRLDSLEQAVKTLTEVVADQHEIRQVVENHEVRITGLEAAYEERISIRREQEALLRAVADKDVIDVEED